MIKFWSICRNTFTQTIRQPIFLVLILVTFAIMVSNVAFFASWTMDPSSDYRTSDNKMLVALGVSTLLITGLLLSAFSASNAISREIEDCTALTVISKPVSRATFVLGKFAGVAGAIAVAYYLCALVLLYTVRHGTMPRATDPFDWPVIVLGGSAFLGSILIAIAGNYLFGWTFVSAAVFASIVLLTLTAGVVGFIGKGWQVVPFGTEINPQLLIAIVVTFFAVLVFTAIAVAASTRLGQIMTLLICCGVLFLGYLHPFLFGKGGSSVVGWLVPNLWFFDTQDALIRDKAIPGDYVVLAAAYCCLYVIGVLATAVALFHNRSLEAGAAPTSVVDLLSWFGRIAAVLWGGLALVKAVNLGVIRQAEPATAFVNVGLVVAAVAIVLLIWISFARGIGWSPWLLLPSACLATSAFYAGGNLEWARRFDLRDPAIVVAAAVGYAIWSFFARGAAWSYWLVLLSFVLTAAAAVVETVALIAYPGWSYTFNLSLIETVVSAALACAVVIVLVLPRTRHHFSSISS